MSLLHYLSHSQTYSKTFSLYLITSNTKINRFKAANQLVSKIEFNRDIGWNENKFYQYICVRNWLFTVGYWSISWTFWFSRLCSVLLIVLCFSLYLASNIFIQMAKIGNTKLDFFGMQHHFVICLLKWIRSEDSSWSKYYTTF